MAAARRSLARHAKVTFTIAGGTVEGDTGGKLVFQVGMSVLRAWALIPT